LTHAGANRFQEFDFGEIDKALAVEDGPVKGLRRAQVIELEHIEGRFAFEHRQLTHQREIQTA
jgi:hypothetical protein